MPENRRSKRKMCMEHGDPQVHNTRKQRHSYEFTERAVINEAGQIWFFQLPVDFGYNSLSCGDMHLYYLPCGPA